MTSGVICRLELMTSVELMGTNDLWGSLSPPGAQVTSGVICRLIPCL